MTRRVSLELGQLRAQHCTRWVGRIGGYGPAWFYFVGSSCSTSSELNKVGIIEIGSNGEGTTAPLAHVFTDPIPAIPTLFSMKLPAVRLALVPV